MKKLLLALVIVATTFTAQARVSDKDCENFGDTVGSMQVIRNKGGDIGLALTNLRNLVMSDDPDSRMFGASLTSIADFIWSKPRGNMDRDSAATFGTLVCTRQLQ